MARLHVTIKWASRKGNKIGIVANKSVRKKCKSVIIRNVFNTKWVSKKIINSVIRWNKVQVSKE